MNNEKLYQETVDIILDAYNNKQLVHGDQCGCFIGNIVKKRYDVKPYKGNSIEHAWSPDWFEVLYIKKNGNKHFDKHLDEHLSEKEGLKQIKATGYSIDEIIQLEWAFEKEESEEEKLDNGDISQYQGMKAALKKLAEIHDRDAIESIEKLDKIKKLIYS